VGGIHCSLYPQLTFLQIERKISCLQLVDVALATAAHSMQAKWCQNRVRRKEKDSLNLYVSVLLNLKLITQILWRIAQFS